MILNPEKIDAFLDKFTRSSTKKLLKDPALVYATMIYKGYINHCADKFNQFRTEEEALMKTYLEGIFVMFPDKKVWPDANSTMRITYGKVEGSAPYDGMKYTHFTTIDGIMQKYDASNPDFQLTDRFIELYNKKDFGDYMQDDELFCK